MRSPISTKSTRTAVSANVADGADDEGGDAEPVGSPTIVARVDTREVGGLASSPEAAVVTAGAAVLSAPSPLPHAGRAAAINIAAPRTRRRIADLPSRMELYPRVACW